MELFEAVRPVYEPDNGQEPHKLQFSNLDCFFIFSQSQREKYPRNRFPSISPAAHAAYNDAEVQRMDEGGKTRIFPKKKYC